MSLVPSRNHRLVLDMQDFESLLAQWKLYFPIKPPSFTSSISASQICSYSHPSTAPHLSFLHHLTRQINRMLHRLLRHPPQFLRHLLRLERALFERRVGPFEVVRQVEIGLVATLRDHVADESPVGTFALIVCLSSVGSRLASRMTVITRTDEARGKHNTFHGLVNVTFSTIIRPPGGPMP